MKQEQMEFTLNANNYEGRANNYTSGIDKNDIITFSHGECAIVVYKGSEGCCDIVTAYRFKWSKYGIIRYMRFLLIYVKFYFSQILK